MFTYSETEHYEQPSATTTLIIERRFSKLGFTALDQTGTGKIPMINMDQVFQKGSKTIFFKQGLLPSKDHGILKMAGGYAYHGVTDDGINYALFFDGMSLKEVEKILSKSDIAAKQNKSFFVSFSFIHRACASDTSCNEVPSTITNLSQTTSHINTMNISSIAGSCAISALKGAANGAKDLVQGTWNTAKTLFTNPEKLWTETKKAYGEIKDLVANFSPRMKQFIESMRSLDPEVAAEIVCSTISSIIVQAVIGGGIAKAAIVMTTKFLSLDKIKNSLLILSRLKSQNQAGSAALTSRLVSCAR